MAMRHTLSIQEVADGDGVSGLRVHGALLEHLIGVLLGAHAHVLLAESLNVVTDVCALLQNCQSIGLWRWST